MPKIIENLEARLMEEAKKQVLQSGYGAMTIRSVAKGCGVGIGTVYNYYPSKDALLAAYMIRKAEGESMEDYLKNKVFANAKSVTVDPEAEGVEGFKKYLERYEAALAAEQAAAAVQ